jgi:CheY-like chemotaxis protein
MIFEEFQRGAATDRPTIGGFGLGLSIVQRMAEALGHPLDLCSRLGHGTRFSVSAPSTVATAADRVPLAGPTTFSPMTQALAGARIIVIDNDPSVLEAMQTLLERWECEVLPTRSLAGLATAGADNFHPHVILADYHLDEGASGTDVIRALRSKAGRAIPAIVITADRAAAVADAVRAVGCELLLKPVKPAELRALMLHLIAPAAPATSR